MYFQQIATPGLGCFSYVIGCPQAHAMAVVDPRRDTHVYRSIAEETGMRITHIFDTHVHADHISGAQQLRAETGADIYIHASAPVDYEPKRIEDGDEFRVGQALLRVLHTPGHTPNSISLLVADLARSPEPAMVLTGDLLFVGDVGRPDLPGEEILDEQIRNLYVGLYKTLGKLPAHLAVFPGHGQGSLCGRGMSAMPSSTLGYERIANPMMRHPDFESFRRTILSHVPMRPLSFSGIIAANLGALPILSSCCSTGGALTAAETASLLADGTVRLLDLRDRYAYAAAHIPGSIHVDASSSAMLNWIGVALPFNTPIVLVLPQDGSFDAMRIELQRIGYDTTKGYLRGGIESWLASGRTTRTHAHLAADVLRSRLAKENAPFLVDVRRTDEFEKHHIEGVRHVPLDRLVEHGCPEALRRETVVVCQSGYRAAIAASLLEAHGCTDLAILAGGMNAWATPTQ